MATTPNFGWPYPTPVDAPDGAGGFAGLALASDATVAALNATVTALSAASSSQASQITALQNSRAQIIARGRRTTNQTSNSATEQGLIRLDDIPIVVGRGYRIHTSTINMSPSVAGLTAEARIRITTDGSTPTSASTQVGSALIEAVATSVPRNASPIVTEYYPAGGDTFLSVFFGWVLVGGVGTVTCVGSTTDPISIYVEDMGVDVGTGFATVL